MAAASASSLASSVEKTNGNKLSRLLIDGGTTALRNLFDSFHPPPYLMARLNANKSVLQTLLKRGVLHKPQWEELFPPSGTAPDSNTFDITLLFLLLTTICKLRAPASGWHKPPPATDTSLEANLTRTKLFRNELYGHVTTTGVKTSIFNVKWKEVSAVLVALGLSQIEIDQLKSAPSGEDYVNAITEWVKSDDEIQSKLEEVVQVQKEGNQTLELTKQAVEEIHRTQQETHQMQQKDHLTLQDTHKAVDHLVWIQQGTNQMVREVLRNQQQQKEGHGATKEIVESQRGNNETLQELKKTLESLNDRGQKHKEREILKGLAKVNTQSVIEYHAERYQQGTRLSILDKVERWLDDRHSQNRVMVISGHAGMGKSVMSAVLCKRLQEAEKPLLCHFCQYGKARHGNPKLMIQSLASQLSSSLAEYREALVENLSRNLGLELNNMEINDLCELLFEESLCSVTDPGKNILVVIDGIDESEYQGRNALLEVIANNFYKFPSWIRFFITTRPEINIADSLRHYQPLQLDPSDEENVRDIRLCFKEKLSDVMHVGHEDDVLDILVQKSQGVILFSHFLIDFVKKRDASILSPQVLDSTLPLGISSVYQSYFKRLETELCKELEITEDRFLNFLSAIVVAREPLPLGFISQLLLPIAGSVDGPRKVSKAIACISGLLPVKDGCIHFFHKSIKDWLTDKHCYGQHDFTVDANKGQEILSRLCAVELDDVKRKGVDSTTFSDTARYALQHGVQHMLDIKDGRACDPAKTVKKYVVDLDFVYAKLCVSNTAASEDIICCQKNERLRVLLWEDPKELSTLLLLLRKYSRALRECPHSIFQTVMNEGGPEMSSQALSLLEGRYSKIPYMECIQKEDVKGSLQARFLCSAEVACFDVSPHLDFMVCECRDGTIHLWSLHTGKLLWVRPVVVIKSFCHPYEAYRRIPSTPVRSFCRSVVFHPGEEVVLPGILSHAYTLDGEFKPLFPKSGCHFTVCSISGAKDAMLTDCPDDSRCIIMWSLKNGSEITRIIRNEDVLSFAWCQDGSLIALSHFSGTVCLLDEANELAQTITPEICGMLKFSGDQSLLALHSSLRGQDESLYHLNIHEDEDGAFSLNLSSVQVSYQPSEFESLSEAGFLFGDPVYCLFKILPNGSFIAQKWGLEFVLSEQAVLRSSPNDAFIDMLNTNELTKHRDLAHGNHIKKVEFSLNGDIIYVVCDAVVMALDVSSGQLKRTKSTGNIICNCLVSVREGVLFATKSGTLELWDFGLSNCVRKWSMLPRITHMARISEERVACVERQVEVNVLDTTSGDIY